MTPKLKLTPLEKTSILRKFSVYFMLVSIVPLAVLFRFYIQIRDFGQIGLAEANFRVLLILIVMGISLGYLLMRKIILQVIKISGESTKVLKGFLGENKVKEIVKDQNEFTVIEHSFKEINLRLEKDIEKLEKTKKSLYSVMSKISYGLSSTQNIDNLLELIIQTVTEALSCNSGVLMLFDEKKSEFLVKVVFGLDIDLTNPIRIKLDESGFESIIEQKKPVMIFQHEYEKNVEKKYNYLLRPPILYVPLVLRDKVLGVVSVSRIDDSDEFKEDDMNLLRNVASQMAVAIENERLNHDIEVTYFETIAALALAVEAKDHYSHGHLERVVNYAVKLGEKLNLEKKDIKALRDAARLHDLGKIGISDDILNKPGPLTDEEWVIMKKHPEIGANIIMPVTSLKKICVIIRQHHEKLDGSGYPYGLKTDKIDFLAKILVIADIYDALTTDRPYRKRLSKEEAMQVLLDMSDSVDQNIVGFLRKIIFPD